MQNLGEGLVRQACINAVDGTERWREWCLIQQARQDAFLQGHGCVPFKFDEMRGCGLLRPDEQQHVVGCDCFPNGFRPLLAPIETVLVTPDSDAMRHKVLQEWLQS